MNLTDLEQPIKDIIALVEKFDERYREKCFEILLNFYLSKELQVTPTTKSEEKKEPEGEKEEFLIPIDVRAFLLTYDISEEILSKLFLIQKDEVRPVYKIETTKKSLAQIQIALLIALEHAIRTRSNRFEFSMETVRQRCKDHLVYDADNFSAHFKNNKAYFKSLDDSEHVELSADGRTELADVISTVAKK